MFNFPSPFKFRLDSPVASVIPVISMKETVSFVFEYPNEDSFCENSNLGSQRFTCQ